MALFKISKGKSNNLPTNKVDGYCYVTTNDHKFYVDYTKDDGTLDRFALNAVTADTAQKLGTINVGNSSKPIYLEEGTPKECVDFLPLTAGESKKLTGPLGLTENINYGTSLPDNGFDGQLFFLEDENIDGPSLPTGGTTGQVLVKNSSTDGDASWATNITGNAATATKATQDGNGNIISSTYLPLSAGENSKLIGPLGLTENINYGTSLPDNGFIGQIFFLENKKNIIGISNGGTGATTASEARANIGAVNMVTAIVTLSASSWSNNTQTVNVNGVTTNNIIIISPDPDSIAAYCEAGVHCTTQSSGELTFTCDDIPSENLAVNVAIFT